MIDCDWVDGGAMVLRREALERVGGFDERFFAYCEEAELCLRITRAGWRVGVLDGARAQQAPGGSSRPGAWSYLITRNGLAYARRRRRPARSGRQARPGARAGDDPRPQRRSTPCAPSSRPLAGPVDPGGRHAARDLRLPQRPLGTAARRPPRPRRHERAGEDRRARPAPRSRPADRRRHARGAARPAGLAAGRALPARRRADLRAPGAAASPRAFRDRPGRA